MMMMVMMTVVVMGLAARRVRAVICGQLDRLEVGLSVVVAGVAADGRGGLGGRVGAGLGQGGRRAGASQEQWRQGQDDDQTDEHGASFELACGSLWSESPHRRAL
jgi:hypothetical protein